jgi:YVTN family beta-propeller protein
MQRWRLTHSPPPSFENEFAMTTRFPRFSRRALCAGVALAGFCAASFARRTVGRHRSRHAPVVNASNMYSEAGFNHFSPAVAGALSRIYVPNLRSDTVSVIDPATFKVVDTFPVGQSPQHVVPAWDLQDVVGDQQRRGPQRRQPHPDRSEDRQAGHGGRGG